MSILPFSYFLLISYFPKVTNLSKELCNMHCCKSSKIIGDNK